MSHIDPELPENWAIHILETHVYVSLLYMYYPILWKFWVNGNTL